MIFNQTLSTSTVIQYALYLVVAIPTLMVCVPILIILIATPKYRRRKETLVFTLMLSANAGYAFGYVWAGIRRLILVTGGPNQGVTAWDCMLEPTSTLFTVFSLLTAMMVVVISADRLICTFAPLAYQAMETWKYWLMICCPAYGVAFAVTGLGWFVSYYGTSRLAVVNPVCLTAQAYPAWFTEACYYLQAVTAMAGGLLYVVILYRAKQQCKPESISPAVPGGPARHVQTAWLHNKRQQRMTKTVGYIMLASFVLYALPALGKAIVQGVHSTNSIALTILPYLHLVQAATGFASAVIYLVRREAAVRKSLLNKLCCA